MGTVCSAVTFNFCFCFRLSMQAATNTYPIHRLRNRRKTKSQGLFSVLILKGNGNVPFLGLGRMHLPCVHSIWFTFIKHLKKNKMLVLPLANVKKNLTRYPRAHLTQISLRCPCYTNMKACYALVETDSERVRVS